MNSLAPALPRKTASVVPAAALFLIGLLLAASGFRALRLEVSGLLVHPYLFPTGLLFLFVGLPRLARFPRRALGALAVFLFLYLLAALPAPGMLGETVKVGASAVTLITAALLVRRETDFHAATLGMSLAMTVLAVRALAGPGGGLEGVNPLEEIANKNAFSLYCLPALLLAGYVALDRGAPRPLRIILAASMLAPLAAIFASANRSGWLGALLIALMLFARGRRLRVTLLIGVLAAGTYWLLVRYNSTEVFEHRFRQTVEGTESDTLREELLLESLRIGLENPILGVSPQLLPDELGRRLAPDRAAVDPHNALGFIAGGCGFPALLVLFVLGHAFWRRPRGSPPLRMHALLRMMLVLWLVRGMFSREILYAPGFTLGLGIVVGACIRQGVWVRR